MYADVLFIIDFSMDTVSLWLTGKLLHSKMKTVRIAAGAAFGAVSSTLMTALAPPWYVSFIAGLICSALMCLLAFGRESIPLSVKRFAALWVVGMLLGGLMTFLMSGDAYNGAEMPDSSTKESAVNFIPIAVLACAVLLYFLSRVTLKKSVSITVSLFDKTATLHGIIDSGNLLRDPLNGEAVTIISQSAAVKLLTSDELQSLHDGEFDGERAKLAARYRIVPAKGVGGMTTLACIRPDVVTVCGKTCRTVIAIADDSVFGESIECIVPAALL